MRPVVPWVFRATLLSFLLLSTAVLLFATARNARTVRSLAETSLESTAQALSASAENALRAGSGRTDGAVREILSDRVVAYALIAAPDGKILFHTNPMRIGRSLGEEGLADWLRSGRPFGRRVTLGTGLPAYEFDYVLHRPDGRAELLRLVLHTAPADRLLDGVSRMWLAVSGMLVLLWAVGIALERVLTRHLRMQAEADRNERLALIGRMTATLAHEIRNALGAVKGYTQWVDEKTALSDPRKQGLSIALKGTERIESLVNELLLFAREETFSSAPVDLPPLLESLVREEAAGWPGQVAVDSVVGVRVLADPDRLRRILANGVRNAIQAMGETGVLRIGANRAGKRVRIFIEDSGPGIPETERPRLFTPFHTTKPDGTGLGLAYAKKAVEAMKGRIDLRNREDGSGAVFEILLPKG